MNINNLLNFLKISNAEINEHKESFIDVYKYQFDEFLNDVITEKYIKTLSEEQRSLFLKYDYLQNAFNTFCTYNKVIPYFIGDDFELLKLVDEYATIGIKSLSDNTINTTKIKIKLLNYAAKNN